MRVSTSISTDVFPAFLFVLSLLRCESDYCGGCNRHYYNADGVEVCQPRAAEASECDQSTCTPPECPQGSTVEQDADDCCPHCASSQAPCSNVRCNMHPECPQGWLIETAPGECCPTCKPRSDCSKLCKMRCPNGYVLDENGCPTCECLPFS